MVIARQPFVENGYLSLRFPNKVKVKIHEHWMGVTRFNPLWVSDIDWWMQLFLMRIFITNFQQIPNSTYLVSNTGYKCLDVQLCGTALLTGCISTFKTSAILVTKIFFYRLSNTWEKMNLYNNNNNNNCINSNEINYIQHMCTTYIM